MREKKDETIFSTKDKKRDVKKEKIGLKSNQ